MSLQAFQQVIVDLTLAPRRVRQLLRGDLSVLANYDLTERERRRVLDAIQQPGMALNCTIARGNRFEPVAELFPMTCVLLKPVLRELLDELWEAPPTNYQFEGEDEAFTAIVRRKMASGELAIEYLEEIFGYECCCAELARRMRGQANKDVASEAIIEFRHPPELLLIPLSEYTAPPPGLPTGTYRARLILRGEQFDVEMLSASLDGPDAGRPN